MLAQTSAEETEGGNVPTVFCYSLFYVYYDQYTYITGVLAQDVLLGLIAVFIAIQVSISFSFFAQSNDFKTFLQLKNKTSCK